jgi:hypothetical protein
MTRAVAVPAVGTVSDFRHLRRLTTPLGVFEHCLGSEPRPEHGYCTDDVARALIAVAREPTLDDELLAMAATYLDFLEQAHRGGGVFANRRDVSGRWLDEGVDDDACGRALWGLGTAAALLADVDLRARASTLFDSAARFRSRWIRSTAFATLGAAMVTTIDPTSGRAYELLEDSAETVTSLLAGRHGWPWPEDRMTYANAAIPEMMLVLGQHLEQDTIRGEGLSLLSWLIDIESSPSGWLSVTPVGGWQPGQPRPAFDQQPIEVATLADACATAWEISLDPEFLDAVLRCGEWFLGSNDVGVPMLNTDTGGGFDGLTSSGPNLNQGAESTIAAITTLQHARRAARDRTPVRQRYRGI